MALTWAGPGLFFSRPFNENFNFLDTVRTIFIKCSSHSTPKGAPACVMVSKLYDWDLRSITKIIRTSRERHKSAPYLRLRNNKRTSNSSIPYFTSILYKYPVPEKPKKFDRICAPRNFLRLFNIHSVAEHQNIEGGPFGGFF